MEEEGQGLEEVGSESSGGRTCLWMAMSSGEIDWPMLYQPRKSKLGKTCLTVRPNMTSSVFCVSLAGGCTRLTLIPPRDKVSVVDGQLAAVVGGLDDELERVHDLDIATSLYAEQATDHCSRAHGG